MARFDQLMACRARQPASASALAPKPGDNRFSLEMLRTTQLNDSRKRESSAESAIRPSMEGIKPDALADSFRAASSPQPGTPDADFLGQTMSADALLGSPSR